MGMSSLVIINLCTEEQEEYSKGVISVHWGAFFMRKMKIINSDKIKNKLLENIKKNTDKKILIIYQTEDKSVIQYKNSIIKRCKEFNIQYDDKEFDKSRNHFDILSYIKNVKDCDGFILLQPLSENTNLSFLREYIKLRDLDGFTYNSLGKIMDKDFSNIPQTAKSVIRFLKFLNVELESKDIVIANSNNVIGKPLAMYLSAKKATVTLFNSKTKNQREKIKKCDIFISAIGKPHYYDKTYFRDGQILIDVGMSFEDGKLRGDINRSTLQNLDIVLIPAISGVGSITTLSLLETLVNEKEI